MRRIKKSLIRITCEPFMNTPITWQSMVTNGIKQHHVMKKINIFWFDASFD